MKRLIIIYLTSILLSSCGTGFVVRKYTEGRFHEHIDNAAQESVFKDTIIIKKFKKGSSSVTRIKSNGGDVTIEVDENNSPLTNQILDAVKLSSAEEKHKVAGIKSIEKHARISRAIFWLPGFGFFHNVSYLRKANEVESKYNVDLSTAKKTLRKSVYLSIPFFLLGIIFVLVVFLIAISGISVVR
ncbi:MAG: hypothetical protein K0S53_3044 [Bacteroidetes bacterium]|jgi:hypothetical protein|nr:hypothetical protein [Bacteroidota bacterium]MDF2453921.1 hypothetical protein [Bacteroidota bacterium]